MSTITLLKWAGTFLQASGCLLLALNVPHSAWAFPIMLIGSGLWLAIALVEANFALATLQAFFVGTNIIGILRWLG